MASNTYLSYVRSDNFRTFKGYGIVTPTADTYNLIEIPLHGYVFGVTAWIHTAGSSKDIAVGFAGNGETADPNFFLLENEFNADVAGYKHSNKTKYFNDQPGLITMTVNLAQTTGRFHVIGHYSIIH